MNIRKFVLTARSLDELVGLGTLPAQAARFREGAHVAGLNTIVAAGRRPGSPPVVETPPRRLLKKARDAGRAVL